mmetsp:Transcript_56768/g.122698  ORF Transcript_56768/g.122698 Transcript_56768/m.122698 type:complete len:503 (-) Transcript_56768:551-2059(-)
MDALRSPSAKSKQGGRGPLIPLSSAAKQLSLNGDFAMPSYISRWKCSRVATEFSTQPRSLEATEKCRREVLQRSATQTSATDRGTADAVCNCSVVAMHRTSPHLESPWSKQRRSRSSRASVRNVAFWTQSLRQRELLNLLPEEAVPRCIACGVVEVHQFLQLTRLCGQPAEPRLDGAVIQEVWQAHEGIIGHAELSQVLPHRLVRHLREAQADVRHGYSALLQSLRCTGLLHALRQDADLVESALEVIPAHPEHPVIQGAVANLPRNLGMSFPLWRKVAPIAIPFGRVSTISICLALSMRIAKHAESHFSHAPAQTRRDASDERIGVTKHESISSEEAPVGLGSSVLGDRGRHQIVPGLKVYEPGPHLFVVERRWNARNFSIALSRCQPTDIRRTPPKPPSHLSPVVGAGPDKAVDDGKAREGHEGVRLGSPGEHGVAPQILRHGLLQQQSPHLSVMRSAEQRRPPDWHLFPALRCPDIVVVVDAIALLVIVIRNATPVFLL